MVTFAAIVALTLTGVPPDAGLTPVPTIALVAWSVAVHPVSGRWAAAGGILALAGVTAIELASGDVSAGGLVFGALIVTAPWAAGFALRRRVEESDEQRSLALDAERRREQAVQAAVTNERERIARELHDVVAHALSITIQAGAAEQQLRRDRDAAAGSLRAVQQTSREALEEMRRMLQLLRPTGTAATRSPQPGLEGVVELVEASARSGVPVELRWSGDGDREVAPGLGLTAYRIVQEALTNVRKHAGQVPTTVTVTCAADELRLEVVNDPGPVDAGLEATEDRTPGHGLIGMRERVALYDGTLSTAATPTGGYAVHAVLARR